MAVCVLCLAYGYFIEPYRLIVDRKEVRINDWPPEFDGFRVVLISDIHGGSRGVDESRIGRLVELANEQDADMVVLLGDYVSQQRTDKPIRERPLKMPMETIATHLKGLRARNGVFAVLGNHDGWFSSAAVTQELRRVGINVLDQEVAFVERDGERLRILGLRDHQQVENWKAFSSDAGAKILDSEGTGPLIVLEHSPDVLPMITGDLAISKDLKLMFAGHTHGGQVWLPILGFPVVPSTYGQKYADGHVRDAGVDMFVTSGVGTSILPFRFLVPPEIMVVTIKSN